MTTSPCPSGNRGKTARTKKRRTSTTDITEPPSIEEILARLVAGHESLPGPWLASLSNLGPADVALFKQSWAAIPTEQRRQTITKLVALAEENFELNFEDIFKSCLKDEDAGVRCQAIEGLWESETASLIGPLIDRLVRDEAESVQAAAAASLGKFAMLAELKKLRSTYTPELSQALLAAIRDKSRPLEVRCRALEAAAPLSHPQIADAIAEAYRSDNPRLRTSAIYAMGKNCRISWLPILIKELDSTKDELRYEAAVACGELGEEDAVPHLKKLTYDTDTDVQTAAIQALGKIGGKEAKEHLERCLAHSSQVISEAADLALEELEAEEDPLSFRRIS